MSDFSVRSENIDVEQIMRQIRSRIREKRGVDYTEDEIRELANVKLEKFIDPKGVRSNLLEEYRRVSTPEPPLPNYAFGEDTLYETHRGPIRWLRALFRPLLKLLFNPNPLIHALHIQAELNQKAAERHARREQLDALHYEVIHNLVVELTRTGVEVKSLKMRLESMASRLDFDERRARALEGVVQYRAGAVPPLQVPTGQEPQRRHEGRRDEGRRDQQPRRDRDQQQRPRPQEGQPPSAPPPPREAGQEANALDNDGNERRARRRRRRGRRRPGEERGGQGTEDRGQRTDDRGQGTEDRGQKTEDRVQATEARGQDDDRSSQRDARSAQSTEAAASSSNVADRSEESRPPISNLGTAPDLPSE